MPSAAEAVASSRPSQYGSSVDARSMSSTRPPGNTYMPAAKAAFAVRRSTKTSTPAPASGCASASRTMHDGGGGAGRDDPDGQWLAGAFTIRRSYRRVACRLPSDAT